MNPAEVWFSKWLIYASITSAAFSLTYISIFIAWVEWAFFAFPNFQLSCKGTVTSTVQRCLKVRHLSSSEAPETRQGQELSDQSVLVIWVRSSPHRFMSPASSTALEGCGTLRRWSLTKGSGSLEVDLRFYRLAPFPVHSMLQIIDSG